MFNRQPYISVRSNIYDNAVTYLWSWTEKSLLDTKCNDPLQWIQFPYEHLTSTDKVKKFLMNTAYELKYIVNLFFNCLTFSFLVKRFSRAVQFLWHVTTYRCKGRVLQKNVIYILVYSHRGNPEFPSLTTQDQTAGKTTACQKTGKNVTNTYVKRRSSLAHQTYIRAFTASNVQELTTFAT